MRRGSKSAVVDCAPSALAQLTDDSNVSYSV